MQFATLYDTSQTGMRQPEFDAQEEVLHAEITNFFNSALDKSGKYVIIDFAVTACGRGGIGIRARLRGVSVTGYGFKSRRPHQSLSFHGEVFLLLSAHCRELFFSDYPLRSKKNAGNAAFLQIAGCAVAKPVVN